MQSNLKEALADQLTAMADDELVLGHRNSEWCGYAPILEEDIAFANIALDEIGHAAIWYTLMAELLGKDRESYTDEQVYRRNAVDFRNVQFVELPKGDWALSIMRQYLFDLAEMIRLESLVYSQYPPLAAAGEKIRREEIYHQRHSRAWVQRLGMGTNESKQRMQTALAELWPYAYQLFAPLPGEAGLVKAGYFPATARLQQSWDKQAREFLEACELNTPKNTLGDDFVSQTRNQHTPHLIVLVNELQSVAREDPVGIW